MMNPPFEQQLLDGIEQRNDVICRQAKRIEALEALTLSFRPLSLKYFPTQGG